jgi:hypothetical protein
VDVVVDPAADELARALGGQEVLRAAGHEASVIDGNYWRQSHRKSCERSSVRFRAVFNEDATTRKRDGLIRVAA